MFCGGECCSIRGVSYLAHSGLAQIAIFSHYVDDLAISQRYIHMGQIQALLGHRIALKKVSVANRTDTTPNVQLPAVNP